MDNPKNFRGKETTSASGYCCTFLFSTCPHVAHEEKGKNPPLRGERLHGWNMTKYG